MFPTGPAASFHVWRTYWAASAAEATSPPSVSSGTSVSGRSMDRTKDSTCVHWIAIDALIAFVSPCDREARLRKSVRGGGGASSDRENMSTRYRSTQAHAATLDSLGVDDAGLGLRDRALGGATRVRECLLRHPARLACQNEHLSVEGHAHAPGLSFFSFATAFACSLRCLVAAGACVRVVVVGAKIGITVWFTVISRLQAMRLPSCARSRISAMSVRSEFRM